LLAQHSLQTSQKLQQAIPNPSANNGQLVIMSEAPTSKFMQVQGLVDSGDFEHFEPPPFAAMPLSRAALLNRERGRLSFIVN
jgi:hypothetical protein